MPDEIICMNYTPTKNKACVHYSMTKTNKVGLCMLKMKNCFLCHYSELYLGIYKEDAEIVKMECL